MDKDKKLSEEYFEFMLKRALTELADEEGKAYLDELEGLEEPVYSKEHQEKIAQLRSAQKASKRSQWMKAAITAGIVLISVPIFSDAANANMRQLFSQIFSQKETHFNIGAMATNLEYDFSGIPNSWEYFCIPNEMPYGYSVETLDADEKKIVVHYLKDEQSVVFCIAKKGEAALSYSTEQGKAVKVSDQEGYYIPSEAYNTLVWYDEDFDFYLQGSLTKKELLEIAENLKSISY